MPGHAAVALVLASVLSTGRMHLPGTSVGRDRDIHHLWIPCLPALLSARLHLLPLLPGLELSSRATRVPFLSQVTTCSSGNRGPKGATLGHRYTQARAAG